MSHVQTTPAPRSFRSFLGVAVLLLLVLLLLVGLKSYRDLAFADRHVEALEGEVAATEERIRLLNERIRRLEEDPITLEQLAREDLGLVREWDVVIVLPEPSQQPPER